MQSCRFDVFCCDLAFRRGNATPPSAITPPKFNSLPLKDDGKGRRSGSLSMDLQPLTPQNNFQNPQEIPKNESLPQQTEISSKSKLNQIFRVFHTKIVNVKPFNGKLPSKLKKLP